MCLCLSGLCTFTVSYIFVDAGTLVLEYVLLIFQLSGHFALASPGK